MRILYHHRTAARDGSAVHINGLVNALRAFGAEVRIVAPGMAAHEVGDADRPSLIARLRKSLPRALHELGELAYNVGEVGALNEAVADFRPDLIYQRSNLYLLSGLRVARQHDLPLVEEVNAPYLIERSQHGGIALRSLASWAEQKAWRGADAVIAVTQVLAGMVAQQGVPAERLHVMPNGIDESLIPASAIDADAKCRLGVAGFTVLGFTGFVRDWSGLESVIDQLARPECSRWFLLIVGDGPARAALESRARSLGVAARLRFTGVVKREDIAGHVSAFDIALQPAANPYASPLKLFEYLALGRAIVAPDQPNLREILTPELDAVLFAPDRADSFAAAVARLAADEALRSRLSAAARLTVQRRGLTWRHNAQRVIELAQRLIGERHHRSKWLGQGARPGST
jgi:glycosyltransferase involved in cell wall biosynthesis